MGGAGGGSPTVRGRGKGRGEGAGRWQHDRWPSSWEFYFLCQKGVRSLGKRGAEGGGAGLGKGGPAWWGESRGSRRGAAEPPEGQWRGGRARRRAAGIHRKWRQRRPTDLLSPQFPCPVPS